MRGALQVGEVRLAAMTRAEPGECCGDRGPHYAQPAELLAASDGPVRNILAVLLLAHLARTCQARDLGSPYGDPV
jgi:hypothetical protein